MSDARTVLVSGAGGFIGGRAVEMLHQRFDGVVRAGVRRWGSAARIGRLPVELVKCDLSNESEVREAMRGVTHLVHCAVGDPKATARGTRTLLKAAKEAGVARVVHLSTIDVYGGATEGEVDETSPLKLTGRPYGDSKIEAEGVCQEMAQRGLPITILRPTLVHGPFSASWTIPYAQRLQKRPWLIPDADARGTCNLVYVDDLVEAIFASMDADTPPGEAFNVNGPERPTWSEYFHALNAAMGLPPLAIETATRSRMKANVVLPFRKTAKFLVTHFHGPIMGVAARSDFAREMMIKAEQVVRTTPVPEEFAIYGKVTSFSTKKAESELGYRPRVGMAQSLPLTAAWLRHHGFVESPSS